MLNITALNGPGNQVLLVSLEATQLTYGEDSAKIHVAGETTDLTVIWKKSAREKIQTSSKDLALIG